METQDWEFPETLRPKPDGLGFDLDRALGAVLGLTAQIPEDAYTAQFLGTERAGNAIFIEKPNLVLTIGYLMTEAERIWLKTAKGTVLPGHPLAYDYETGFGLVMALGRIDAEPLPFGTTRDLAVGQSVIVAGEGGRRRSLAARLVGKREFAGYWEYVLEEALFTVPAHPHWGGTALIGPDGKLYGCGSLFVQNARGGDSKAEGNMIVPIDLLPPILEDMKTRGRADRAPRAWLGLYAAEHEDRIVVVGLAPKGPAEKAGVKQGDIVVDVAGAPVGSLPDFFRTVWQVGPAGVDVPLTLWREGKTQALTVKSTDRSRLLKSPRLH